MSRDSLSNQIRYRIIAGLVDLAGLDRQTADELFGLRALTPATVGMVAERLGVDAGLLVEQALAR